MCTGDLDRFRSFKKRYQPKQICDSKSVTCHRRRTNNLTDTNHHQTIEHEAYQLQTDNENDDQLKNDSKEVDYFDASQDSTQHTSELSRQQLQNMLLMADSENQDSIGKFSTLVKQAERYHLETYPYSSYERNILKQTFSMLRSKAYDLIKYPDKSRAYCAFLKSVRMWTHEFIYRLGDVYTYFGEKTPESILNYVLTHASTSSDVQIKWDLFLKDVRRVQHGYLHEDINSLKKLEEVIQYLAKSASQLKVSAFRLDDDKRLLQEMKLKLINVYKIFSEQFIQEGGLSGTYKSIDNDELFRPAIASKQYDP